MMRDDSQIELYHAAEPPLDARQHASGDPT